MVQPLRILIIGLSTLDLFVRDVELPGPDNHAYLEDYKLSPGGSAVNLAVSLTQLGARVHLCTRVGTDIAGQLLRTFLRTLGIGVTGVIDDASVATGFSIIKLADDGRIGLLHFEGANARISVDDVATYDMELIDIVHVAGAMSMDALDGTSLAKFMEKSKSIGKITSLHTSRNTDRKESLFPVLPHLDYVFMNEKEAQDIAGTMSVERASLWLHSLGISTVAVTLGVRGAYVSNPHYAGVIPSFRISAIDTTGCGDAFTAGFLDALWRNENIRTCAAFGNALGALCAQSVGAIPRAFSKDELSKLVALGVLNNSLYRSLEDGR